MLILFRKSLYYANLIQDKLELGNNERTVFVFSRCNTMLETVDSWLESIRLGRFTRIEVVRS